MKTKTLSELEDLYVGLPDTPERNSYEAELDGMRIGLMIRDARLKLELTQEELAERVGKKRSFISRIESSDVNVSLRTLREIVEAGLGAKLQIAISL